MIIFFKSCTFVKNGHWAGVVDYGSSTIYPLEDRTTKLATVVISTYNLKSNKEMSK